MKGTDCTPDQLKHARDFIEGRGWTPGLDRGVVTLDDVSRLLAWYGAMRFMAGRDGAGGTLESPGPLDVDGKSDADEA